MRNVFRHCLNCKDTVRAGCLCVSCLRAAIIPVVIAEAVRRLFS